MRRYNTRTPTYITGFYTTQQAAEKLGVDPSTLKYRRDTADAKEYWKLKWGTNGDRMYELLSNSHVLKYKHHYYRCDMFDEFVKLYLQRPEVQRARARRTTFPKQQRELFTHVVRDKVDLDAISRYIEILMQSDGKVTVALYGD